MRPVSLGELILRAKRLADMERTSFVSDAEWRDYANRHITQFWDVLVQAGPPDYLSADMTFQALPGVGSYPLPSDFRSLCAVRQIVAPYTHKVSPLLMEERGNAKIIDTAQTILLEYVPAPPVLVSDAETIDGVSGWEDLISAGMARDALVKAEDDISSVQMIVDRETLRMNTAASNRDRGQPKRIGDRHEPGAYANNLCPLRYRLRGANLELYTLFSPWLAL